MFLPECWVDVQSGRKNAQSLSQFDVSASPHPFISDSLNYEVCLFGRFIIFPRQTRSYVFVYVCVINDERRSIVPRCGACEWPGECSVSLYI